MTDGKIHLSKRPLSASFRAAFQGVLRAIENERNFRVELTCAIVMIILLWWLAGALWEWVAVIVCIMIVLSLELLNTALENLLDYINPKFHPLIGTMKDMTAGAVLVGSVGSIAVGLIIIVPKFVQLFSR